VKFNEVAVRLRESDALPTMMQKPWRAVARDLVDALPDRAASTRRPTPAQGLLGDGTPNPTFVQPAACAGDSRAT
jgi:hypothetical protein